MPVLTQASQSLFNWLFPARCVQCNCIISAANGLCQYCLADLPLFNLTQCPNLLLRPDIKALLPRCEFDLLSACAFYQHPLKQWLTALKFNNQIHIKVALQQVIRNQLTALFQQASTPPPDAFVILPLHRSRFYARGFNQVSQVWVPCLEPYAPVIDCLRRNKNTAAQTQLSKAKRIKNLHGAFVCQTNVAMKTIAIVDDVITTGATLNAAAIALREAGVKQVWAFATCLTPL